MLVLFMNAISIVFAVEPDPCDNIRNAPCFCYVSDNDAMRGGVMDRPPGLVLDCDIVKQRYADEIKQTVASAARQDIDFGHLGLAGILAHKGPEIRHNFFPKNFLTDFIGGVPVSLGIYGYKIEQMAFHPDVFHGAENRTKELVLKNTDTMKLPDAIGNLEALQTLRLNLLSLEIIPEHILDRLRSLDIFQLGTNYGLTTIPPGLFEKQKLLRQLKIKAFKLRITSADQLSGLESLEVLDLYIRYIFHVVSRNACRESVAERAPATWTSNG